jgi:hypothetical protein
MFAAKFPDMFSAVAVSLSIIKRWSDVCILEQGTHVYDAAQSLTFVLYSGGIFPPSPYLLKFFNLREVFRRLFF